MWIGGRSTEFELHNHKKIVFQLFCYICIMCEYIIENNILVKTK